MVNCLEPEVAASRYWRNLVRDVQLVETSNNLLRVVTWCHVSVHLVGVTVLRYICLPCLVTCYRSPQKDHVHTPSPSQKCPQLATNNIEYVLTHVHSIRDRPFATDLLLHFVHRFRSVSERGARLMATHSLLNSEISSSLPCLGFILFRERFSISKFRSRSFSFWWCVSNTAFHTTPTSSMDKDPNREKLTSDFVFDTGLETLLSSVAKSPSPTITTLSDLKSILARPGLSLLGRRYVVHDGLDGTLANCCLSSEMPSNTLDTTYFLQRGNTWKCHRLAEIYSPMLLPDSSCSSPNPSALILSAPGCNSKTAQRASCHRSAFEAHEKKLT